MDSGTLSGFDARRDAGIEPLWMGSRRVSERVTVSIMREK